MNNKLVMFEGKNVEVFEFEGKVLFNPKHVAECLEISDVNSSIRAFTDKQVIKLTNSIMHSMHFRKLHNTGENFLTESGVYKLIFQSRKENALAFQDWICEEVIPSLRKKTGLEGFEAFRMLDKDIQKQAMTTVKEHTKYKDKGFIITNKHVNKITSDLHKLEKPVSKGIMLKEHKEMLLDRQNILNDYITVLEVTNSHASANQVINKKYNN